ncbi:MAG TPA: hypothetical protein VGT41_04510 [Candidatus Babeliales bacterium]|nr:hypothetical protein [Candidatus Babeliales bacterium]
MKNIKTITFVIILCSTLVHTALYSAAIENTPTDTHAIEQLKNSIAHSTKMSTLYAMVHSAIIKHHKQAEPERHEGTERDL